MNFKINSFQIAQLIVILACSIIFLLMLKNQFEEFALEPTGTSMKLKSEENLEFPAVTLCDHHFENAKMLRDIGKPILPFQTPKEVKDNPLYLYETLIAFEVDIISSIWKYYFTLDKMLANEKGSVMMKSCQIGSKSCSFNHSTVKLPTESNERPVVEVEAGTWTSFLLADSDQGNTFLCHTLVPNVTVDFSKFGGNSIAIRFDNDYEKTSESWKLFVHDKNEHVALHTFSIKSIPSITIPKLDENNEYKTKQKAMILPRKFILPEPSDVLPCNSSESYSQTWCQINWAWERKLDAMREFYGDKFQCQLPGIWTNKSYRLPLCKHFDSSDTDDGILGFREISSIVDTEEDHLKPKLIFPPLGNFKESSNCLKRCTYYTYTLQKDEVSEHDDLISNFDVYLYFSSKDVEVWTEYRLNTTLDFLAGLGGSLGLILGMSILSLIFSLMDIIEKGLKMLFNHFRITSEEAKEKWNEKY